LFSDVTRLIVLPFIRPAIPLDTVRLPVPLVKKEDDASAGEDRPAVFELRRPFALPRGARVRVLLALMESVVVVECGCVDVVL